MRTDPISKSIEAAQYALDASSCVGHRKLFDCQGSPNCAGSPQCEFEPACSEPAALEGRIQTPRLSRRENIGGADRDRTDDLRLAKPALSQLSYSPTTTVQRDRWWAWVDLNHRPPAYQADALTN